MSIVTPVPRPAAVSLPRTLQFASYGHGMSDTRYGHSGPGGGSQDQGERKDDGWTSRQGGSQARDPGRKGDADSRGGGTRDRPSGQPQGTNTQGDLAGIGEASDETRQEIDRMWQRAFPETGDEERASDADGAATESTASDRDAASGTDQPRRMGGPLGPDPKHPHLPEGAQNSDTQGTGAGGFDRGVNATQVGAVHQGAREDPR